MFDNINETEIISIGRKPQRINDIACQDTITWS